MSCFNTQRKTSTNASSACLHCFQISAWLQTPKTKYIAFLTGGLRPVDPGRVGLQKMDVKIVSKYLEQQLLPGMASAVRFERHYCVPAAIRQIVPREGQEVPQSIGCRELALPQV